MNIVVAIKALGSPGGGAERVLVDVANGLVARGHALHVVSYDLPNQKSFYPMDSRIDWVRLGIGKVDRPATTLETASRIWALRRTIPRMRPSVVVSFMHSVFIPLGLVLIGTGIPMIASEHIVPAHYTTRPLQRALLHLTPWLAHRITVVSEQVMQQYPSMLRAKMVVVPNPIRLSVTSRADVTGRYQSRKILLSVGRLTEQKDFATLIKAFAILAGRHPEWDLRIVGEGELRPDLEAQIAEAGMEGRIFLPGATDNISAEYAASQLFVVSSLYESLGLALIEALAHGLPAVGFADCPGVNLLIQPGRNGALASGADRASALAETLVPLLASAQARQSLVAPITELPVDLDPERVLDCWEDVLHQCASTTH